jgi:hypothetical protein
MFSMSMFDFSTPSDPTQNSTSNSGSPVNQSIISSNFWMYWVVTIPLTLLVLTIWKLWMGINRYREEKRDCKPLKTDRVMAYQEKVNESMEMNTPFYPGKESPGRMLWGSEKNV